MILIRNGSLTFLEGDREIDFESPFAVEKLEASRRQQEKQAWKAVDDPSQDRALVSRSILWGAGAKTPLGKPLFQTCSRVPGRLYYVLAMPKSRGLFYWDEQGAKEIRLFHKEDFEPQGLYVNPDYTAFTTRKQPDGAVHLVKLDPDGKEIQLITSGDCLDQFPFAAADWLYYQSSGLARSPEGFVIDRSTESVNRVHLRNGAMETLAEHPDHDFLLPKADARGNVYYIRRPRWKPGQPSFLAILKDVVLLPYRLAVAVFGFLNVFSLWFAQKPLMTAGGPDDHKIDLTQRLILGQLMDVAETARKEGRKVAVPRDWQLLRRSPDGREETMADHIVWYDLDPDGHLATTDGYQVHLDGKAVHQSEDLIQEIHLAPTLSRPA